MSDGYRPGQRVCGYIIDDPEGAMSDTRLCIRLEDECDEHPRPPTFGTVQTQFDLDHLSGRIDALEQLIADHRNGEDDLPTRHA